MNAGRGLRLAGAMALAAAALSVGCKPDRGRSAVDLTVQRWAGDMVCYSGYRAGQHPDDDAYPTLDQVRQDMGILDGRWAAIRTYGADRHTEDVLRAIRLDRLRLKVMLGVWLAAEPGNESANAAQVANAVRLANEYRESVAAVSVGNEILVSWSNHKVPEDRVIGYVNAVKAAVSVPVTVDDDFTYWRNGGAALAGAVDFVALHTYPIWGGADIDSGMAATVRHFESVRKALPGKTLVIGEAGWATLTVGNPHAPGAGSEAKQKRYFDEISAWARSNGVNVFFFEAFDEPWKGTGTEGHWGLFTVDRKPKPAVLDWIPEPRPGR
jgi:exo-beta-1,3-glucanase (GH17 family)